MAAVQVLHQRQTLHTVHENAARLQPATATVHSQAAYGDIPALMHANEQKALKSEVCWFTCHAKEALHLAVAGATAVQGH